MRLLLMIAIMGMAGTAYAGDNNGPRSNAAAAASSRAVGVGVGIAGASSAGQSTSVSVDTERSAPAFGLGGLASGPCTGVSGGVALSSPLGGGGIMAGTIDEECTKRETARVLYALGMVNEARAVANTFGPLVEMRRAAAVKARAAPVSIVTPSASKKSDDLGCEVSPSLAKRMGINC